AAAMLALTACGGDNGNAEAESEENFTNDLVFATGGTAGVYYPFGGELATIYENEIDDDTVNYVESGGSAENVGQIIKKSGRLGSQITAPLILLCRVSCPALRAKH